MGRYQEKITSSKKPSSSERLVSVPAHIAKKFAEKDKDFYNWLLANDRTLLRKLKIPFKKVMGRKKTIFKEKADSGKTQKRIRGKPKIKKDNRPIEEILMELAKEIPPEDWRKLPQDLSDNLDHYIYGTPRE